MLFINGEFIGMIMSIEEINPNVWEESAPELEVVIYDPELGSGSHILVMAGTYTITCPQ